MTMLLPLAPGLPFSFYWLINVHNVTTCIRVTVCQFFLYVTFYAPGLKGPPGASSNRIVRLSVRLSARLSVIPSRFQTKCNI